MDDITDYAGRTVIENGVVVNDMPIGAYLYHSSREFIHAPVYDIVRDIVLDIVH